jgi:hypothetical protein
MFLVLSFVVFAFVLTFITVFWIIVDNAKNIFVTETPFPKSVFFLLLWEELNNMNFFTCFFERKNLDINKKDIKNFVLVLFKFVLTHLTELKGNMSLHLNLSSIMSYIDNYDML